MKLELDMTVYHQDVYDGREPLKVIGIRKDTVELEGDYSGGTHNVCQSDWLSISGVLLEKSETQSNPLISLNLETINGIEILEFLENQIDENDDLCDISLCTPLEFEEQSLDSSSGELMYSLSFTCYFNNWGTPQPIDGNEIQITNSGVRVLVGEAFESDGSDEEIEKILMQWLPNHNFKSKENIKDEFSGLITSAYYALNEIGYQDKEELQEIIIGLVKAKTLMK